MEADAAAVGCAIGRNLDLSYAPDILVHSLLLEFREFLPERSAFDVVHVYRVLRMYATAVLDSGLPSSTPEIKEEASDTLGDHSGGNRARLGMCLCFVRLHRRFTRTPRSLLNAGVALYSTAEKRGEKRKETPATLDTSHKTLMAEQESPSVSSAPWSPAERLLVWEWYGTVRNTSARVLGEQVRAACKLLLYSSSIC